jgi:hypothetical protein
MGSSLRQAQPAAMRSWTATAAGLLALNEVDQDPRKREALRAVLALR